MSEPRVAVVTPAQRRAVLAFMKDGGSNEVIAEAIGVSPAAAAGYMTCVLRAAAVPNRVALALALERRQVVLRLSRRGANL